MADFPRRGSRVMYLNKNGYDADRLNANKILDTATVYTVSSIDIGNFTSSLQLEGFNNWFNTVMFEEVTAVGPVVIRDAMKQVMKSTFVPGTVIIKTSGSPVGVPYLELLEHEEDSKTLRLKVGISEVHMSSIGLRAYIKAFESLAKALESNEAS